MIVKTVTAIPPKQMSPNNSVESSIPLQTTESRTRMNTILSSRAFHRPDLSESGSSSIHSNGIHQLNIQEDTPRFNYERERLKSFEGWPVPFLSSSAMAAAGFYFLKREDVVRCAFCGVEVGCWVEGDDPMQDHERWSPSCRFVRKLPVGNVPLNATNANNNRDISKENGYDTCGRIEFRPECGMGLQAKDRPLPPLEKLGIHKSRAPSFPNFATLEARLRSYDLWPIALKLKPKILSEAGFFYTGKGDQTICFHCGGGLKDWEESDEPWVEHARWFSKCNFVLLIKGKDFVDKVCGRNMSKGKSKSEENVSKLVPESCIKEEKNTSQKEVQGESKTEHTGLCKICYNDEMGLVFVLPVTLMSISHGLYYILFCLLRDSG
ncbi:death-associated inhibitor of apoptosis 1 isoform X2 [Homalodisca vitripennis]|uniref:death-associated inhibitor of apoptosis 1 isoform X2 n=1 Tax=Homalodisca vitripennis TaxID=197043 RepID=UPI001EEC4E87|nr:death-associated inhibitor of apoptosis 1 isoform X2 [Homalodisca vitripennis]